MNSTTLTILSLIPDFLRVISSALSSRTTLSTAMDAVLNTAASLIEAGDQGAVELQALTAQIKTMAVANRDPTDQEWTDLEARSAAANQIIQRSIQGSGSAEGTT